MVPAPLLQLGIMATRLFSSTLFSLGPLESCPPTLEVIQICSCRLLCPSLSGKANKKGGRKGNKKKT